MASHFFRCLCNAFIVFVLIAIFPVQAQVRAPATPIKLMTRNIFLGADLNAFLSAGIGDLDDLVDDFLDQVIASDFPGRAEALADEILLYQPDIIGLQEVTLIELFDILDFPGDFDDFLDFLEILMDALHARGLDYEVVLRSKNTEIEVPTFGDINDDNIPDIVRYADYDVILARSGTLIANGVSRSFQSLRRVNVGGVSVTVERGFGALDVTVRGKTYRVANTHLENKGNAPEIQNEQMAELLSALQDTPHTVIVLGDFNSAPEDDPGAPYDQLLLAGYIDIWAERLGPPMVSPIDGLTCCQDEDLLNENSLVDKRVDHIWIFPKGPSLGIFPLISTTFVIGTDPSDRIFSPTPDDPERLIWPSDHGGVIATVMLR